MDQRSNTYYESERARRTGAHSSAKKVKRRRIRAAIRVGLCVCAVVFVAGGVIAGKAWFEDSRADKAYDTLRIRLQENAYNDSISVKALSVPVETPIPKEGELAVRTSAMDLAPLKEINSEIVAWLACEGTAIDYPILQGEDNDYYLNHLYTKESNRMGSLFMDYRNAGLFTDRNMVVYGHNMKSGAMFNALSEYKAQDYYDAFPTMKLYTPDGDYTIELFAGTVEDGNYEFVQFAFNDDKAFMAYVDAFRARSTFQSDVVVAPTDQIVTLCTCSYERNNARYIVMGRLVSEV